MTPILILHGWGASSKSWAKVKESLEQKGCAVFAPDMPGFGENPPPQSAWTSDDYVAWILNLAKSPASPAGRYKLKTPLAIVGHSFGGGLAMKIAIEHPEMFSHLILVATARIHPKPARKSFSKTLIYSIAKIGSIFSFLPFFKVIRKLFYKFIVRERDYLQAKGVMKETMNKVRNEDLTPLIHRIKQPTLIIWGDKDKMTPIDSAYFLKNKIQNSKLEILPNIGHAPNLECPEKLATLIYTFINQ